MKKEDLLAKEAKHGEKMVEIQIRLWTDGIAGEQNKVIPKHAWSSGVVKVQSNKAHGISSQSPVPFHTMMDLTAVIEKVLINHGITLHQSRKMKKYFE